MYKIVLLRHGQSQWNLENRFTGWFDIELSENGINEAISAGNILKEKQYQFDLVYCSVLKRAIKTAWLVLEQMDLMYIPIIKDYRLNERHYGALLGLNKTETAEKHGKEQVFIWRRSYASPPPELDENDKRHPKFDLRYRNLPSKLLPNSESLKDTVNRVIPYWKNEIVPSIKSGKKLLISAHGNSLRSLVKHLDNISDEKIPSLEIPTGNPLVYELDENLHTIKSYYLKEFFFPWWK